MGKGMDANYKESAYNSNHIIKIATILQRSLNDGRCSSAEMKRVSRYITQYVRINLTDCIKGLTQIINSNGSYHDERLREIQHALHNMLQEVKEMPRAYEHIVEENGSVDKAVLTTLINIDNEMTSNLRLLNNYITSMKDTRISENEIRELHSLVGEIELNIKERAELLKKIRA